MASGVYNRGKYNLLSNGEAKWDDVAADFRVLLVTSAYTPDPDHNSVDDVVAHELSAGGGSNYARQQLTSRTLTEDDVGDEVDLDATDITWAALGATAGTPRYAILYIEGISDAARELVAWLDLGGSAPAPSGFDYIVRWNTNGLLSLG